MGSKALKKDLGLSGKKWKEMKLDYAKSSSASTPGVCSASIQLALDNSQAES